MSVTTFSFLLCHVYLSALLALEGGIQMTCLNHIALNLVFLHYSEYEKLIPGILICSFLFLHLMDFVVVVIFF